MAAAPSMICCRFHLVLALSLVHRLLHASPSRQVAKSGERGGQVYGHPRPILRLPQPHLYSSVIARAFPLRKRQESKRIQLQTVNSSLTTQALIRMNNRPQNYVLHTLKEHKLPVNWWLCTYGMDESTFSTLEGCSARTAETKLLRFRPMFL